MPWQFKCSSRNCKCCASLHSLLPHAMCSRLQPTSDWKKYFLRSPSIYLLPTCVGVNERQRMKESKQEKKMQLERVWQSVKESVRDCEWEHERARDSVRQSLRWRVRHSLRRRVSHIVSERDCVLNCYMHWNHNIEILTCCKFTGTLNATIKQTNIQ